MLEFVNLDDVVFITALSKKVMKSAAVDIFFWMLLLYAVMVFLSVLYLDKER